ncbi:MAG: hypothetical protein JRN20_10395 [Nitrososphaerota archaeon]|nr:hypothetical protein [Nitrososphaerota archaeon]MDG6924116.1 hypothetical protein [Nitrososphaerota archaeon]
MNIFAIVAVIAVAIFLVVEVLISYQKYQMKKMFLEEMDKKDSEGKQIKS